MEKNGPITGYVHKFKQYILKAPFVSEFISIIFDPESIYLFCLWLSNSVTWWIAYRAIRHWSVI